MNPLYQLIQPEIHELVRTGQYADLHDALAGIPSADVADMLAEFDPPEAAVVFRFLPRDEAGEVFAHLQPDHQERLIEELGAEQARHVLEAMEPDDRARLLDELPTEVAQRLIASFSAETRRVTQAILGYPEDTVGRLMTPDYVRVRPGWTINQALDHIRAHGRDAETINVVYVVDDDGTLIDDLRLRQLLLASPEQTIQSIMDRQFVALRATDDQEESVRAFAHYDRVALPVVDSRGVLLGIVTHDDIADVAVEETTEDIQKQAGVAALARPYTQTGLPEMIRKRGGWLAVIFLGQTVTVAILGLFETQLAQAIALTLFIPLVISCGGNSGSQAATLVTRALALDEIRPGTWHAVLWREIRTGAALGALLGILGAAIALLWGVLGRVPDHLVLAVTATVGVGVMGVVLWGTVLGSMLPIILRRVGLDPAVASTPLVATLMDNSGILIYFTIAALVVL